MKKRKWIRRHCAVLPLVLKRKWYEMIERGEKTEEYRLITDYWRKRIVKWSEIDKAHIVEFRLGYAKDAPRMAFVVYAANTLSGDKFYSECFTSQNPKWGEPHKPHFVIQLGDRVELVDDASAAHLPRTSTPRRAGKGGSMTLEDAKALAQKFCNSEIDRFRRPYTRDGEVLATDGRLLVQILTPEAKAETEEGARKFADKVHQEWESANQQTPEAKWKIDNDDLANWRKLRDVRRQEDKRTKENVFWDATEVVCPCCAKHFRVDEDGNEVKPEAGVFNERDWCPTWEVALRIGRQSMAFNMFYLLKIADAADTPLFSFVTLPQIQPGFMGGKAFCKDAGRGGEVSFVLMGMRIDRGHIGTLPKVRMKTLKAAGKGEV